MGTVVGRWIKLKKTTGSLKWCCTESPHKLPLDALEKYVKEHLDEFFERNRFTLRMRKRRCGEYSEKVGIFNRKKTKKFTEKEMNRKGKYLLTR